MALYGLYYIASRWSETKGAVSLSVGPLALLVAFAVMLPALTGGRNLQQLNVANQPIAVQPIAAQPLPVLSADRNTVAHAEPIVRQNIMAILQLTSELSRIKDETSAQQSTEAIMSAGAAVRDAETRGQATIVGRAEMVALKHSVGKAMCAALSDLKYEYMRIQLIPGLRSPSNDERVANIQKSIKYWSIGAGEESARFAWRRILISAEQRTRTRRRVVARTPRSVRRSRTAAGKSVGRSRTAAGKSVGRSRTAAGKSVGRSRTAAGKSVHGSRASAAEPVRRSRASAGE